jgi:predicted nucleic acid-binding protein
MSAERAFVDTNVLVYAVDAADPRKREIARTLLAERANELVLSAQVLSEFYVVTTRKLTVPLSEEDAAGYVEELSGLPVVVTDAELVRRGIGISRTAQLSLWDGLIVAAAHVGGCRRLLSEDLAAGTTIEGVTIDNPFSP